MARTRPLRHALRATHIYVLRRSDGVCKIGVSRKVTRRRSQLQTSTPDKLTIVHKEEPTGLPAHRVESAVKEALRLWCISGEWFRCSPALACLAVAGVQTDPDRLRAFLGALWKRNFWNDEWEAADRSSYDKTRSRHLTREEKKAAIARAFAARAMLKAYDAALYRTFSAEMMTLEPALAARKIRRLTH